MTQEEGATAAVQANETPAVEEKPKKKRKKRTIKDVLDEQGRSQDWLIRRLKEKGHDKIDAPQMSRYSNGITIPRDKQIIVDIAKILGVKSSIFF